MESGHSAKQWDRKEVGSVVKGGETGSGERSARSWTSWEPMDFKFRILQAQFTMCGVQPYN